jgi:hypothetical protein
LDAGQTVAFQPKAYFLDDDAGGVRLIEVAAPSFSSPAGPVVLSLPRDRTEEQHEADDGVVGGFRRLRLRFFFSEDGVDVEE